MTQRHSNPTTARAASHSRTIPFAGSQWIRRSSLAIGLAVSAAVCAPPPAHADRDTLVWGSSMPSSLDPHGVFDTTVQFTILNAYDTLYRYLGNPPELTPWLVSDHTVSPDGLTWEFKLRPGIKFHDGSNMTADDVVYSFQRVITQNIGPAGAFRPVLKAENVTAVDPLTVRFVLNKPYAPFQSTLATLAIVNSKLVKQHEKDGDWGKDWLASNNAGSGAYEFLPESYSPKKQVDMRRFEDHFYGWKDNPNAAKTVQLRYIAETSTRVLSLLTGKIDATDSFLPADQVERIQKSKVAKVSKDTSMRLFIMHMNNKKAPFDNLDARKCIAHGFNYEGFINVLLKGNAQRVKAPHPDNLWGYPKDIEGYAFDLKKAKEHCDKAKEQGAPIYEPIELHTLSHLSQTGEAAQLLQSEMKKIGVNIRIVPGQWAALLSNAAKPETTPQIWTTWVSTYFVDPENWVGQMYDSQFHGTWKASSWYKNDTVDGLLREARTVLDTSKRAELYDKALRQVVADAPTLWIYNTVEMRGLANRVQGYKFSPIGGGSELRWISLTE